MYTRSIAAHLYNYARFLDAESVRASAIWEVTNSEETAQRSSDLAREARAVREMAAELHNMKREI